MKMKNLLKETIDVITRKGHFVDEVLAVIDCRNQERTTWTQFAAAAKDYEYDCGYGLEKVNLNLMVVGKDWWLERNSYDGLEWWEFKSMPHFEKFSVMDSIVIRE